MKYCNKAVESKVIGGIKMCEFCKKDINSLKLELRTTYADDNLCEFVNEVDCSFCNGGCDFTNRHFTLYKYDNTIQLEYYHRICTPNGEEVKVMPISEIITINFCPFCGEKLHPQNNVQIITIGKKIRG